MIQQKYIQQITKVLEKSLSTGTTAFIFGSSIHKDHFADIDVGILGKVDPRELSAAREEFEESTIPYKIDLVHFDTVSDSFKKQVFNSPVQWIISAQK